MLFKFVAIEKAIAFDIYSSRSKGYRQFVLSLAEARRRREIKMS